MTAIAKPGTGERIRAIFLFCLLFLLVPLLYMNGVQQPEISLKMPLLAAGMAVFFLWGLSVQPDEGRRSPSQSLVIRLLFFLVAWQCAGLVFSVNVADASIELARLSLMLLFLVTLVRFFSIRQDWKPVFAAGPSLALLALSAYGLVQLVVLREDSLSKGIPFVINFALGSSMGNKNSFAEIIVLAMPFSLYSLLSGDRRFRWVHGLALVTGFFMIYALKSLATWIALIAAALALLVFLKGNALKIRRGVVWISSLAIIVLFAGVLLFRGQVMTDSIRVKVQHIPGLIGNEKLFDQNDVSNNNSVFERMLLWRNTTKMIGEHPFLGAGTGNWKIKMYKYGILGTDFISSGLVHYEHPHNDFLMVLAESGLPGLALMVAFFFLLFRTGLRRMQAAGQPERLLFASCLAVVIMFIVLAMFGYPWTKTVATLFLALAASILIAGTGNKSEEKARKGRLMNVLTVLLLFWIAYVGYQRLRGEALMYQVQLAKYKKDWQRIVRLLEQSRSAYFTMDAVSTPVEWHRGQAYYFLEQPIPAREHFLNAEKQHPYHLQVLNDLGTLSEQAGEHDQALGYFARALAVSPFNVQASLNRCAVFFNLRQADSAFAAVDKIFSCRKYGQDSIRYQKTLPLVLHAVAWLHAKELPAIQKENLIGKMQDQNYLVHIYKLSKKEGKSFLQKLNEEARANVALNLPTKSRFSDLRDHSPMKRKLSGQGKRRWQKNRDLFEHV